MGMYTEIFVNVDLIKSTPDEVIQTLKAICEKDHDSPFLVGKPDRWFILFNSGSYYTPNTECAALTFDEIGGRWSLIGKGDIKNYGNEIEAFFAYIEPWVEDRFMGYMRFEENEKPTLMFKRGE